MAKLKPTQRQDLNAVMQILSGAKAFLRAQGIDQWQTGYPYESDIIEDIQKSRGYCIMVDDEIAGYLCLDFGGEPTYDNIQGAWRSALPYGVIHRCTIAQPYRGKGLAKTMFHLCAEECLARGVHSLRVDTHRDNKIMQHTLPKCGFVCCGTVVWEDGDTKLAYEWLLND